MSPSISGCRDTPDFDLDMYNQWVNFSKFNSTLELEAYTCLYIQILKLNVFITDTLGYCMLITSIFGIASSILILLPLYRNKEFSSPTYTYFRLMAMIGLLEMGCIFLSGVHETSYFICAHIYCWVWVLEHLAGPIANFSSAVVTWLTIVLSVERAVACLLPTKFKRINRVQVARRLSLSIIAFFAVSIFPGCFSIEVVLVAPEVGYSSRPSEFGKSNFYAILDYANEIIQLLTGGIAILSSGLVILGMARFAKKK